MDRAGLYELLAGVSAGSIELEAAVSRLERVLPLASSGMASSGVVASGVVPSGVVPSGIVSLDHHRALRCGFPEVVLGSSKTPADLAAIALEVLAHGRTLLVTRVDETRRRAVCDVVPDAVWHERARALTVHRGPAVGREAGVLIACAGTGDVPVAEEARVTAWAMGEDVETCYDVGVAGLHRILAEVERLRRARVVVVVAGMDGALPSVVAGLVAVPVVAVPTSIGYGMALDGVAPLLAMLNACAPNVSVVNIDNGFGAGYLAALVARAGRPPAANGPNGATSRSTG